MTDDLHSDRLLLTPLSHDYVDEHFRVYSDPRTWQHQPSGVHTARDESARSIERSLASQRDFGFGVCAVVLREPVGSLGAGTFIGAAGAWMLPFGAWNLGYRLAPEAWGRGLAGEAARMSLDAARQAQPGAPVTARVLANNPASVRVLERLGLDVIWQGASIAEPVSPDDTTHLERLIFADRELDDDTLREVVALG